MQAGGKDAPKKGAFACWLLHLLNASLHSHVRRFKQQAQ
jgi:hypothetical protein